MSRRSSEPYRQPEHERRDSVDFVLATSAANSPAKRHPNDMPPVDESIVPIDMEISDEPGPEDTEPLSPETSFKATQSPTIHRPATVHRVVRHRAPAKWFIILPETRIQQTWSMTMILCLIYTVIAMPLRIAFATQHDEYVGDIVVDVLFTIDIAISFITAYENSRGRLETDPKRVVLHYLRTWFLPDTVSVFPFYQFGQPDSGHLMSVLRLPRIVKLLKLLRILKLSQNYRLRTLIMSLEYSPYVHQKLLRIIELALVVLAFSHFSACVWYFLGEVYREQNLGPGIPWIDRVADESIVLESDYYKYTLSMYWSLTTLTTVGYGDISAQTTGELIWAMFTMIMGSTVFAYTTATVASMISERDQKAQVLRDKMNRLRSFASNHNLSTRLRSSLTKRMTTIWTQHATSEGQHMQELMAEFPSDLAIRVTGEVHRELIETSQFASMYSHRPNFILSLFRQLLPLKLAAGEMLAHQGDQVHNWYIVESGELRSVHPGYPQTITYMTFTSGQSLGEIGLFTSGTGTPVWPVSVRCHANCRIWLTNAETFRRMVQHFGLEDQFVANALESRERLQAQIALNDRKIELLDQRKGQTELALTLPATINAVATKMRSTVINRSLFPTSMSSNDLANSANDDHKEVTTYTKRAEELKALESMLVEMQNHFRSISIVVDNIKRHS